MAMAPPLRDDEGTSPVPAAAAPAPAPDVRDDRRPAAKERARDGGRNGARNDCDGRSDELRGLVRDIRVEAEHVVRALDSVDAALALTRADAAPTELDAAIAVLDTAMRAHVMVVDQRFGALHELFRACPKLYDAAGDEIAQMSNLWNEALAAAPRPGATADFCRTNDPAARAALGDIAWHAALVTVPQRVIQHMRSLRVGGQLKFDDSFADELTDAADRLRMLEYLRAHPTAVSG